jgi:hypothetical protein
MRTREKKRIVKMFLSGLEVGTIAFCRVPGLPQSGMYMRKMTVEEVLREALAKKGAL